MSDEIEPESGTPAYCRYVLGLRTVTGLCSRQLVEQLVAGLCSRDIDFDAVVNEIGLMEGAPHSYPTGTKPAETFSRGRLKGLWHKHYHQAAFIPHNILDYWFDRERKTSPKLDKLIEKAMKDDCIPLDQKSKYILHKFFIGGLESRSRERQLTGEWIIFIKHDKRRYYLTLAGHREEEARIIERIKSCSIDFPEIDPVLSRI